MTRRSPLRKAGATTADGAAGKMTGATEKSLDNPYTYVITSAMLARQVTLPRRIHSANSFVRMPLPPLGFSCLSFTSSRRLFSIACSLFVQNRGVGMPLSTPSRRRVPINSFASYYIPVTRAISCDYARFCATATRQTVPYQWVAHSSYRHGSGTPPYRGGARSESGRYNGGNFDALEGFAREGPV